MEMIPMILLVILIFSPIIVSVFTSIVYLGGAYTLNSNAPRVISSAITVIGYPVLFLIMSPDINDCCSDSAAFSPEHKIGVYILIALSILSFIISISKGETSNQIPPIPEVLINVFLAIGMVLNIVLSIHLQELFPVITASLAFLFAVQLVERHRLFILQSEQSDHKYYGVNQILWQFLKLDLFKKFPAFILLCLPLILVITAVLVLFGQEPDTLIRSFTDTYKHGFSALDYECEDVVCNDDCYVCTIAATGSQALIKTERIGIRNNQPILCSRQLLISSAFEKLWSDKFPNTHRVFRKGYDAFGSWLQRNPSITKNKTIATLSYILLKPLEWIFLITLYTFYRKPENIIASRYLSDNQAQIIDKVNDSHSFNNPFQKLIINAK